MNILDNKKAIIFDLDGVLFHSSPAHEKAYIQTFEEFKLTSVGYKEIAGMRTDDVFEETLSKYNVSFDDSLIRQLTLRKRQIAYKILKENPPIALGCYHVVKQLAETYTLAIASSSSSKNVELFLEASKTKGFFSEAISGEQVEKSKPFPDIFLYVLEKLSLPVESVVIIEDSLNGIDASCRAKIDVIGLSDGNSDELIQAGACRVINCLEELLDE